MNRSGCSVACVSFVIGKPYRETRKLFNAKTLNWRGVYTPTLVKILNSQGLHYARKKLNSKNHDLIYIENTIIYTAPSQKYETGHYWVHYHGKFMNSWSNYKDIDDLSARAEFVDQLIGEPIWAIYPTNSRSRPKSYSPARPPCGYIRGARGEK